MYERMMENLLNNLKTDRVHRIDVNFKITGKYILIFIKILIN